MREPWVLDRKKNKGGRVWAVRFWEYEEERFYKTRSLGMYDSVY